MISLGGRWGAVRSGQGGWLGRGVRNGPVPAEAQTDGAWFCAMGSGRLSPYDSHTSVTSAERQGPGHAPKSTGTQPPVLPSTPSRCQAHSWLDPPFPRPAMPLPASSSPSCKAQSNHGLPDRHLPSSLRLESPRPNVEESSKSMWLCSSLSQSFSPCLSSTYCVQWGD